MSGSVEFAWARVSARRSRRPSAADWHRIENVRSLPALLEASRGTALEAWTAGVDAALSPHAIEALLRARWRDRVAEVARWMPACWQSAVAWWSVLPDLAVLAALARGTPLPPSADAAYRDVAHAPPAPGSPWAPLARAWSQSTTVSAAWQAEWRRRWPRADDDVLDALARAVAAQAKAFAASAPGSGAPLRAALAARLDALFRRATATPAAAFVHLAQILLDGERVRGELLRRAALPRVALAR